MELDQNAEDMVKDLEFKEYLKTIRELSIVETPKTSETVLDKELTRKMNTKKVHEVQTLKTIIDSMPDINTIIDIGGGVGHLSCALISNTDKKSICIDINPELQVTGAKKIKRWFPELTDKIHF